MKKITKTSKVAIIIIFLAIALFMFLIIMSSVANAFDLRVENNTKYWYSFNLFKVDLNNIQKKQIIWGGGLAPGETMSETFDGYGTTFIIEWMFSFVNENNNAPEKDMLNYKGIFFSKKKHDSFISEPSKNPKIGFRKATTL